MNRIKTLILSFAGLALLLTASLAAPATVLAADCPAGQSQASCEACEGIGLAGTTCDSTDTGINQLLKNIINILSAVVGAVAVIMVVIGGLKYVTSGGDANKVSGAKNTLLYAIIGLVIVALAQVLVHFVINKATKVDPPPAAIVLSTHKFV